MRAPASCPCATTRRMSITSTRELARVCSFVVLAPMLKTTPFHARTSALCASHAWRRWAGYVVASSYELSRSEEHTSELQSQSNLVCRLLLEKKKKKKNRLTKTKKSNTKSNRQTLEN